MNSEEGKQKISELIGEIEALNFGDSIKLDHICRRSALIIGKIFGDNSRYFRQLANIGFPSTVVRQPKPNFVTGAVRYAQDTVNTQFQWQQSQQKLLNVHRVMLEELNDFHCEAAEPTNGSKPQTNSNRVFVVHGHDEEMKQTVARILDKLGLEPIILHEQPNQGRTVIEKFEDYADVGFAVVLLSPDDLAYSDRDRSKEELRARQNVVLELGFFIGRLGRERVLPLARKADGFKLPSDYDGVIYSPYEPQGNWQYELVREMKAVGYILDANCLI